MGSLQSAEDRGRQECYERAEPKNTTSFQILPILQPKKEPQCPYRLLNILFSDVFSEGFSQLENVADRAALDAEKAVNNQLFQEGVQEAFRGQDKAYNNLHFTDDEVLSKRRYTNFKKIVAYLIYQVVAYLIYQVVAYLIYSVVACLYSSCLSLQ